MTDPMKTFENVIKSPPAPGRKAAALEAAMRAYDAEFEAELAEGLAKDLAEDGARAASAAARESAPEDVTAKIGEGGQETRGGGRLTVLIEPVRSLLMSFAAPLIHRPLGALAGIVIAGFAAIVVIDQSGAPMLELSQEQPFNQPIANGDAMQLTGFREAHTELLRRRAIKERQMQMKPEVNMTVRHSIEPDESFRLRLSLPEIFKPRRANEAASERMVQELRAENAAQAPKPTGDIIANADANPVKLAAEAPVSTFSVDVDTASYAWMRRLLRAGRLPAADEVRIEELINYFPYDYPAAEDPDRPFSVTTTLMAAPWAPERRLLRIGLRGYEPPAPPRAHSTFLIDISGSMNAPDKLPLLIASLRLFVDGMGPEDTLAIVTYAGDARIALPPTAGVERTAIHEALDALHAGGGTAGAAGIETAYRLAEARDDPEAVNRVILATDGDFNIGPASTKAMEDLIAEKRRTGVYLSVLGFGRGNLNDAIMQALAQAGNGQAAYIDSLAEAQKALVEERRAMTPIAEDVKIQIEFNPAAVQDYRLIGYETRALARRDFNNDKVDAGEIGAGHRVTAIYEITPAGAPARVDPLRYQGPAASGDGDELAFLRLRWKAPGGGESRLSETPIPARVEAPGAEARFAAAVAGFGEILRRSDHLGDWSHDDALALAVGAVGDDRFGYRAEFLSLVRLAKSLDR